MPIADFNSKYLTPLLEKLNREDKFCFLMGDFNINLMKINSESDNSQFYDDDDDDDDELFLCYGLPTEGV